MIKIVGFLKLACVVLLFLTLTAWPGRAAELMDPMPDFSIRTFDGSTYSRESLKGKPLMLVFWNTWCPICRRELP
ncbi:MAG: redoxin domain-containing protein, partial [Syntrophobacteraceae bacterium]